MIKLFLKDLRLFFKDKRAVLLTFLLPIVLISLFAFAFGGIFKSSSPRPKKLLICDLDNSQSSKSIVADLDSLDGLKLTPTTFAEANSLVSKGSFAAALVLHKGLQDSVDEGKALPAELLYDKAREMEIGMLQPVLIRTLMTSVGKQTVTKNIERYLNSNFPNIDKGISDKILSDANAGDEGSSSSAFDMESKLKLSSIVGEKKRKQPGLNPGSGRHRNSNVAF
jgi:ABC-2 family transporter